MTVQTTDGGNSVNLSGLPPDLQAILQQALTGDAGGASGPSSSDPQVYLGHANWVPQHTTKVAGSDMSHPDTQQQAGYGQGSRYTTTSQAYAQFYDWTQGQRLAFAKKMYAMGYLTSPTDVAGAFKAWQTGVDLSAAFLAGAKKQNVDPLTALGMWQGQNADTLKARADANGGITTSKSVDLLDYDTVKSMATEVMQQRLGRNPTDAEVRTFFNTVHEKQTADPYTTTQDVKKDPATGNTSETVTHSGFNPASAQDFLDSSVQQDPEAQAYQGATSVLNSFMAALGG